MRYLLDTHIIMWALIDDPRLSKEAKELILDPANTIYYSTISPWEVEIKHLKDPRFRLSGEQLCFLCDQNGLLNLTIQNRHIDELKNLEKNKEIKHKDPFDRMLLAQARSENMILISHDRKLEAYQDRNLKIV